MKRLEAISAVPFIGLDSDRSIFPAAELIVHVSDLAFYKGDKFLHHERPDRLEDFRFLVTRKDLANMVAQFQQLDVGLRDLEERVTIESPPPDNSDEEDEEAVGC